MFEVGDEIGIECSVQPGPFSEEHLVTIETVDGAISGFVRTSELKQIGNTWIVKGIVKGSSDKTVDVWVKGSFLTTNGLAHVSQNIARAA